VLEIKLKMFGKKKYYPWVYFKASREDAIYKNGKGVPKESAILMGSFVTRKNLISKLSGKSFCFNVPYKEIEKEYKGKFIPFENGE